MDVLAERIRAAMDPPYTGMCYAASEAYYHLAGGKDAGLTPVHMPEPDGSMEERHWALRTAGGEFIDLTVEQYGGLIPDYAAAIGCGFMTRAPSRRGQALIDVITTGGEA